MNRLFLSAFLTLSLAACAPVTTKKNTEIPHTDAAVAANDSVTPFSSSRVGEKMPGKWEPLIILRTKKPTRYSLVSEGGTTVLHAYAAESSSGLMHRVDIDPVTQPWLHWKWKVGSSVETFDPAKQETEDSPARIILGFDGDKGTLPFADQVLFETAKVITGHDFPYATLMYIWDKNAPIGTILTSHRSSRIKMLVVANSRSGVGQWQSFKRNFAEDFEKAYGEKPGKLIGVGVLTDTDNLDQTVEAWYGDIQLQSKP
jgi:hypothetical protein